MAEAALAFCCPVCLEVPRNPVTIPCGHSYCRSCISGCWDQDDQKGIYSCPQCRQTFSPRPALSINRMLADLAETLRPVTPDAPLRYAEHDDVPCDVCTGRKYIAVKSCLVCVVSFCEMHLKPHCVSAAYQSHTLVTASRQVKQMICSAHKKPLAVYCKTDDRFVCLLCVQTEHREHDVVSAANERQVKQREIEKTQINWKKRIQRRKGRLKELTKSVETIRCSAREAVDDMKKIQTELTDSIKAQCSEITRLIKDQEKTAIGRVEQVQEQLQQEISELQQRHADVQRLLQSEDDFLFLQGIRSLPNLPRTGSINLSHRSLFRHVRKSISERQDKILTLLRKNLTQLSDKDSYKLTLDLKTAHNNLHFSERNTRMQWGRAQSKPDHQERFDSWWQVLNAEGLTGCWYWEVEWNGIVFIAVSYKSIATKGAGIECGFGRNDQSWSLCCTSSHYTFWHANVESEPLKVPSSSRVGVYVDHGAGTLSFYEVSDSMSLIHRVRTSFTQPLFPGFGFRLGFLGSIKIDPID